MLRPACVDPARGSISHGAYMPRIGSCTPTSVGLEARPSSNVVVGFVGAGRMGEPMVRRLLSAGHHVVVHARRREVRERLWIHGAALADSAAEVAAGSDIVISCLASDAQLRCVGLGSDGVMAAAKPGSIFVSHTTGSLATLHELRASRDGAPAIVDAPVRGTPDDAWSGALTVLLGGPDDALAQVRPMLTAYAGTIISAGPLGSGLRIKSINDARSTGC